MNSNELYIAGRKIEIPRGQAIALTKQINDIASLRQKGNLSTTFNVPHIFRNEQNLGFVSRPGNTSKIPYRLLPAYYVQNGIQIVSNGNAVITDSDNEQTSVTLYWGNSDFFERLNFNLSELDTSEINHVYNLANAANLFDDTDEKAFYALINLNNENLTVVSSELVLNIERTPPAITFKYLFEKIAEKIGFEFSGNIFNTDFFNTLSLQLTSRKPTIPDLPDRFIVANFFEIDPPPAFFDFTPIIDNDNSFTLPTKYTNKTNIKARFKFRIEWDSSYNIINMGIDERITFEVLLNDVIIFTFSPQNGWVTARIFEFVADMAPDDYLQMRYVFDVNVNPANFFMGLDSKITTIDIEKEELEIGDTFNFSDNMPDITAADLMLRFAQLTGTIFSTENRSVQFIQYEDIKATQTEKRAFPVKPLKGSIRSSFDPRGYSQNNIIRYAEFVREETANAKIDNTKLNDRSDFRILDFYLPELFIIFNTQTAKVIWFENDEQQDILSPIFNYQNRALDSITKFKSEDGATQIVADSIFPSTLQVTPQAIRDTFYKSLFEVLNDFKMYSANFLINESQFNEIKNYEAYYIEELMCFIYPESIQNFVPGRETKINMVKL